MNTLNAIAASVLKDDVVNLSLKYPRDGMGRLHLRDDRGFHSFAKGCGYDKRGTVLGHWINEYLGAVLAEMRDDQLKVLYGINRRNDQTWVDGGCGENCMIHVLETLGFKVVTTYYVGRGRNTYVNGWIISASI